MDMSLWLQRDWFPHLRALDRHDWITPIFLGDGRMPPVPDWLAPRLSAMIRFLEGPREPFLRTKFACLWRLVGRALAQGRRSTAPRPRRARR